MHLNSCLDVSDLTQKEFLKPGETELALISKSMVFKFSFFLFFLPLAGVGTWEQDRINYRETVADQLNGKNFHFCLYV